jgi:tRNA U55 pseudouridine synthase TruB
MPIYTFYKQEGELMNDVIEQVKQLVLHKRVCYAGRLDPLAKGIIIIMTDDDVMKKELFCKFDKTYKFTLLCGFKTDTFDIMGMITDVGTEKKDVCVGKYEMKYPSYSSYSICGKPYWYYTKNNLQVPFEPSKNIDLIKLDKINDIEITGENLLKMIIYKINKVQKMSFRQFYIIESWKNHVNVDAEYHMIDYEITLSSGGFVRYFGNLMNGACLNIERIRYVL